MNDEAPCEDGNCDYHDTYILKESLSDNNHILFSAPHSQRTYRYNLDSEDIEYLMIRRKDTLGYVDFLRGRYSLHNKLYLLNIFGEMTVHEKEKIRSSEKIKWVYLKPNSLNIKQIAFKGYDDPPEIMEFIQKNVDYEKQLINLSSN